MLVSVIGVGVGRMDMEIETLKAYIAYLDAELEKAPLQRVRDPSTYDPKAVAAERKAFAEWFSGKSVLHSERLDWMMENTPILFSLEMAGLHGDLYRAEHELRVIQHGLLVEKGSALPLGILDDAGRQSG